MLKEDTFSYWTPLEIVKGSGSDDEERVIQGIASTEDTDLQGEIVKQNGIDFSYFLKHGWLNLDHLPGIDNKVGEPLEAKITNKGFWIKGKLLKGKASAEKVWEHIKSLQLSNSNRPLGFSIQGKVVRREGNVITKCWIQDVAITPSPVNPNTFAELVKSLNSSEWDLSKDNCEEDKKQELEDKKEAALSAGYGNPLVPQSLEGKKKQDLEDKESEKDSVEKSVSWDKEEALVLTCELLGTTDLDFAKSFLSIAELVIKGESMTNAKDVLAELQNLKKGMHDRAATKVESMVGEGADTHIVHRSDDSNPGSWAGTNTNDHVANNGAISAVADNGTDFHVMSKLKKSIMDKVSKGEKLDKFEQAVVKAMFEMDDKEDKKDGKKDEKAEKAMPMSKEWVEEEKKEEAHKSLRDFVKESDELSKGIEVSGFLAAQTEALEKSLNAAADKIIKSVRSELRSEVETQEELNKSVADSLLAVRDALKLQNQRLDQIESMAARAPKSVQSAAVVEKSFGTAAPAMDLNKSQVSEALMDLVKSNRISAKEVIAYETTGQLSAHAHQAVSAHYANRK